MATTRCWPWPVMTWSDKMDWPAPNGWPAAITDSVLISGLPSNITPTTVDESDIFHLRALTAEMTLDVSNDGGSTSQVITLDRYRDYPNFDPLIQGDEDKLIPGMPGYYIWRPWWYGEINIPIGVDGDFIIAQLSFNTEARWSSLTQDIAFFNLRCRLHVLVRLGEPADPHETEFFADTTQFAPTGGTFTLSIDAETTGAIPALPNAGDIQTALSVASIAAGYSAVTVYQVADSLFFITWNEPGEVPAITADVSLLTPASTFSVQTVRTGDDKTTARQLFQLLQVPGFYHTGEIEIFGGNVPLFGSDTVSPTGESYAFNIGGFTPTAFFTYNGVWDAVTGARLTPPKGP